MAGILTSHGNAPYAATKHAVVGLAEWLSITYHDKGIRVHLLAPLGVRTPMLGDQADSGLRPAARAGGGRPAGDRRVRRRTLPHSHRPDRSGLDGVQDQRAREVAPRHAQAPGPPRAGGRSGSRGLTAIGA
ncbi:MAG: SDR family oxidoreductase [Actinomycetia bacterium]|nr:SDR family oxidoreductase [Actinomycetes bacterium]